MTLASSVFSSEGQTGIKYMIKPPEFKEIISQPLSEAELNTFLAEQTFQRYLEWAEKNQPADLFKEVK